MLNVIIENDGGIIGGHKYLFIYRLCRKDMF